ncbi:MAG: two-component sensor histidine kinase [Deltaproteobacteria bacterium]|nr:two-component sensor histidine kinase [Deltaproteobacteria bacterium]
MINSSHYATMKRIILAIMILVPFIPFVIVLAIGYYHFTTSLETNTIASMKRIVEDHGHMIDSFLQERKANLEFILHSYEYEDLADPQILYNIFVQLQKESNAFVDLGVFNEEGIHVTYQGPYKLIGRDYGEEEWFKEVRKKGVYISDVFLGFRRIPHFIIALKKTGGKRTWIIRATIDTYMFTELVKRVRIGKTGEAYVLNREGVFQTERRSGGGLMDADADLGMELRPHDGIRTFLKKNHRGDEYLYATTWIRDKRWVLVVRQEKADAFKALRSAAYMILLIMVIGGAVIVGVAFYLTEWIVRRMEQADRDKDRLGQQLIRATRLAELGEMAAGFAHEINNPLQIIKSEQALIETILSDLKEKGEVQESEDLADLEDSIAQIDKQIERCSRITQAILKFGRKGEPVSKDIDLKSYLPEIIGMIAKKASVQGIAIREEVSEDTPSVYGDPGQLQQVLINLFNNAMDAIIARHGAQGGELGVEVQPTEDGKVEIRVSDNGCGISAENLKRIFSPFFTTKPVGKGTGLGLSVCYGIVDHMGGTMEVSSEENVGTTFTVRLPVAP